MRINAHLYGNKYNKINAIRFPFSLGNLFQLNKNIAHLFATFYSTFSFYCYLQCLNLLQGFLL